MKKILLVLLLVTCVNAQVADFPEVDIVYELKNELTSGDYKSSDDILEILKKYFANGCKIFINGKGLVLKEDRFKQCASVFALLYPKRKISCELKVKEVVPAEDEVGSIVCIGAILEFPDKHQQMKVALTFDDQKLIKLINGEVSLSTKQSLMLSGIFNLLSY